MTRKRIPLGLDERHVSQFAARDPRSGAPLPDDVIDKLVTASRLAREQAAALLAVEEAEFADTTRPRAVALLAIGNAATKAGDRVAKALDVARTTAAAAIAEIDRNTFTPPAPRDVVAAGIEAEVRTRLAALSEKERNDAIDEAFATNNLTVIGAVLRGPAMLSGLSKARLDNARHRYRQQHHAQDVARRERLEKALDAADRVGNLFVKQVAAAINLPETAAADAAVKKRADAAAALEAGEQDHA